MTRVLLAVDPEMARHAAVEGSPLEGRTEVHRVEDAREFDAALPEADAVLASPWSFSIPELTADRWSRAEKLRAIAGTFNHRFGGWLDLAEARRRGVAVIDTSRSMSPAVAEFGLAMTLNVLRDIPAAVQLVRAGGWRSSAPWDQPGFVHGELSGRRVGLAGYGAVNRRYAELLAPFRCEVMAFDPNVPAAELQAAGITARSSLEELAADSEILVVGIPATPATQGVVSRGVIDALPRGAVVVVLTRMAVVDQAALWERAQSGGIRAAVDVFEPEPPPPDAAFRVSPWVIPTPHIAGSTSACHRRCFTTACEDVLAVLEGATPHYAVTAGDDTIYRGTQKPGS
jgi:phosphoglycerate dehydrogenase-like enzyme